jgi:hypothetical protein
VNAERPGRGVKSDEAGGRVIWEDFHNKRWMDGWTDGWNLFFFWKEAKGAVGPPLLALYIYCCWVDGPAFTWGPRLT